jgi:signal transduction histidine kinase
MHKNRVPRRSKLDDLFAFLQHQSPRRLFAATLLLVAAVGTIDYLTGYEIDFYQFYSAPILLIACFGSRSASMLVVFLCTLAWWCSNAVSGQVYSREWLRGWELLARLIFFGLALLAGLMFKRYRDASSARVELLEKSQQLESEIINISEREQQRIGRDLHDGLCQYLAAIGFTSDWLQQDLAREAHPHAKTAGEIKDVLQDVIARAREMARGLSPVDRDEGGFAAALEELAASTSRLTGVRCSFLCSEPTLVRDDALALHLFRIAQESINNALQHGRAKTVIIALEANHGELVLRVSDDGIGFDSTHEDRSGMGLNIMRYRSDAVSGVLEIYPNVPSGTVIACTMRYPEVNARIAL